MMRKSRLGAVATLIALLQLSTSGLAAQVIVVDSQEASYLRASDRQAAAAALDQQGVSALLSAIAGLLPPSSTSLKLSRVIDSILKPSPFVKPRACVVVNVAGLTADDVTSVFEGRNHRSVDVVGPAGSNAASVVIDAVTAVASANPDVAVVPLEQMALLQDCGQHCLQQHVDALVAAVSAELIALDIARPGAERLFAVELANALAGARAYLRDAEGAALQAGEVVEVTLLGLHQLAVAYGADAPQVAVAKAAVLDVLRLMVASFDTAFGGDVVYQVALVDSVPARVGSMQELLGWKERSRKQLLQLRGLQGTPAFPGDNEAAQAKSFSIKAAAYGSFILLLYFSLAAVYCMCNMPFKADTMLFGRTKAE